MNPFFKAMQSDQQVFTECPNQFIFQDWIGLRHSVFSENCVEAKEQLSLIFLAVTGFATKTQGNDKRTRYCVDASKSREGSNTYRFLYWN